MKRVLTADRMIHLGILCALLAATAPAAEDDHTIVGTRLRELIERRVVSGGVMLVAQNGQVISLDAAGLADIEANRPMHPDTLFWIASMTKPITASAIMILQDDGKLSVEDPAGKYLPEFNQVTLSNGKPPARPITIADLLSHVSGVSNPAPTYLGGNPTLAEMAAAIAKEPLQFEPGSQWKYGVGLTNGT
jgi:CubicO group peptidase (beta-lactamase class C family)